MNADAIKKSMDEYYQNTTPEQVVAEFEALGVEFVDIETPMLNKLREYLTNTPREQIERDWAEVKALGLNGPTAKEFVDTLQTPKMFEIQEREYTFFKYSRKRRYEDKWRHFRNYKTLASAKDAIRDLRAGVQNRMMWDYPAMGNVENEAKYPHLIPTLCRYRYRIINKHDSTIH
jgi:hypothetical protein